MATSTEKNFRILNSEDKENIEKVLKSTGYKLGGGSREVTDDGKINYHLSLHISSAATIGTKLGQDLRKVLKADEVLLNIYH